MNWLSNRRAAKSVSPYDFSTLCITKLHDKLIKSSNYVIDLSFKGRIPFAFRFIDYTFRFIDDLITISKENFEKNTRIYKNSWAGSQKENKQMKALTFLIWILRLQYSRFNTKLNKAILISISIEISILIRMPYKSSHIPYVMNIQNFIISVKILIGRIINQRGLINHMKNDLLKL